MPRNIPSWAVDLGYTDKIKPLSPNVSLADHGLKGPAAKGNLPFSRSSTRKTAQEDAADAVPPSDALTPDQWSECEQMIGDAAEDTRRGLGTWFSAVSGAVQNYIRDCTPSEFSPDQLREAIKAGENDLRHFEIDDKADAEERHDAAAAELKAFKDKHKSHIGERTPDIKKSIEQAIAILLFIMIVEGCFNALLFKDAQSSGLLGGVLIAFGVSAVNVGFGVCAGLFGFRYLHHPQKPFQVLGGVVAGVFVLFGIFLNFFVAHYRDAVEHELLVREAAGSLAGFSMFDISPGSVIGSMFPNIFGLDSLIALGLLFIGFTVFAIAVYEGYDRITDRYPGYGRVWRNERKAYEHRQAVRNGLRDDLSDYFTDTRRWFDSQQSRHVAAKREIEKAMTLLEVGREEAMAIAARCGDQERGLKVAYRQAHRRTRNALRDELGDEAAVPAYFDEIITPTMPNFEYGQVRDMSLASIKLIEQNISALSLSREWLETHIQKVQKGLSSVQSGSSQPVESIGEGRRRKPEERPALSA